MLRKCAGYMEFGWEDGDKNPEHYSIHDGNGGWQDVDGRDQAELFSLLYQIREQLEMAGQKSSLRKTLEKLDKIE